MWSGLNYSRDRVRQQAFVTTVTNSCFPIITDSVTILWAPSHKQQKSLLVLSRVSNSSSLSPSAYISVAPTGRIFVKFDIGHFYENLSINSKFCTNRTKISGTLREDVSTFKLFTAVSTFKLFTAVSTFTLFTAVSTFTLFTAVRINL
jgi:hypothetical protein